MMIVEIQTAIIAAVVALITASISGYISWVQIKRERQKIIAEIKQAYTLELYKVRLSEYPKVVRIIERLSTQALNPLTPNSASEITDELNQWFYSAGGLVAEASTRGALIGLRDACVNWRDGVMPPEIREWRTTLVHLLRQDLDLISKLTFDPEDRALLLEKIKAEVFNSEITN